MSKSTVENITDPDVSIFQERMKPDGSKRPGDIRGEYQRDRARVIHASGFRRLQGKTQVMGVGEGDFHRTRLTHSIECAQIGAGLLEVLNHAGAEIPETLRQWMPNRDLIESACFAHDIGHPPFGHGGEQALHSLMKSCGGFEGNGQTLRILSKLEKYRVPGAGINPTRRFILTILKYPSPYSAFDAIESEIKPPKCYFDDEVDVVDWALEPFSEKDRQMLCAADQKERKPQHHSFDCSIMELADDIAYGIHDIEDIVARKLADQDEVFEEMTDAFRAVGGSIKGGNDTFDAEGVCKDLFKDSFERKQMISKLVNFFVTSVKISQDDQFEHPLLSYNASLPQPSSELLKKLRKLSYRLVIRHAKVQQLEQRGKRVVHDIFEALVEDPTSLIPAPSWKDGDVTACRSRRVCDYVAGMTDGYAEKLYRRLFVPGFGSSSDEL